MPSENSEILNFGTIGNNLPKSFDVSSELFDVRSYDGMGYAITAKCDISSGVDIVRTQGKILTKPTVYTVAVTSECHIDVKNGIQYTAHSCNPNCIIKIEHANTTQPEIILHSIQDIKAGEKITFDYNTTEWEMAAPFDCKCGAKDCQGKIAGMKFASDERKRVMLSCLSPFVLEMVEKQNS